MSGILNRVMQIAENEGISITALEKNIGASKGVLSRALAKNTDIQSKWLQSIVENYHQYNVEWLLTGNGDMLKGTSLVDDTPAIYHLKPYEKKYNKQDIPLYDINAAAGLKTLFAGGKQNIIDTLRIPNLSKVDGAMFLTGDSMYPLMKSGDIIIFKEVHNLDYLHLGDIHILAYEIDGDEYVVVKYVNKSEKEGFVKLVSYNDHYPPLDIPISSILTIALVKANIRYNTMQ
ncbi:S24 family peptidase [Dysgonomonas sp. Marseille-P4361]|uniref:S24 family peptidase n=1 Tax=Dysgonomonas sp. Marseille-P4361 TaxID=2161820 RepID=UPI000D54EED9|nr:S24 family peptidase [Dysgonomonas sp. Marseille-P4361]